jgi:hypothetical protein
MPAYLCNGLCQVMKEYFKDNPKMKKAFAMLEPSGEDFAAKDKWNAMYWASGEKEAKRGEATGLRKTIIAFCAVLNKEL